MSHPVIQEIEKSQLKSHITPFKVGDRVEVLVRITEGDRERVQSFIGTCIARSGGSARETFTVRRIVQGEGVERVFPLHSPSISGIRVRHRGEVRRAKLFYLRDRKGKATRIKGRMVHETELKQQDAVAAAAAAEAAAQAAGANEEAPAEE